MNDVVEILVYISITIFILMYIDPNFVKQKKQATRYVFWLDYVTVLTSQVRCYYIIVLLNAILTIVQLSGTSVVSIKHIKLKISKKDIAIYQNELQLFL